MALLCFVVDVPRLRGSELKSVQQSLLHLADLTVLRTRRSGSSSKSSESIGLCALRMDPDSRLYKLEVICEAKVPFIFRDFHHAVHSLNSPAIGTNSVEPQEGHGQVSSLSTLLLEKCFSCSPQSASKRIVMISNGFIERAASFKQTVSEAANRCIMIDFIEIDLAEHTNDQCLFAQTKATGEFHMDITEFDNCTFQSVQWNSANISRLVKQWLQDLGSDDEGPLEVVLSFQMPLVNATSKVFCTFYPAVMRLNDVLKSCEACRCHGIPLNSTLYNKRMVCPVTGRNLDGLDLANNCIKIGDESVLQLPSFKSPPDPPVVHKSSGPPIFFTVIGCVYLALLSEGLLFGLPHVVVPSAEVDMELSPGGTDELTSNDQTFTALCQELHSKDSGLLCTSTTDIESGIETSFLCFYILLPVQSGSLLAKRIASSEELVPFPSAMRTMTEVPDHVRDSISLCLSKMEAQSYDPLQHERGSHLKLSWLVKESLQFRPTPLTFSSVNDNTTETHSPQPGSTTKVSTDSQIGMHFTTAAKVLSMTQAGEPANATGRYRKVLHNVVPQPLAGTHQHSPNRKTALLLPSGTHRPSAVGKTFLPVRNPQQSFQMPTPQTNPVLAPREPLLRSKFRRIRQGQVQ